MIFFISTNLLFSSLSNASYAYKRLFLIKNLIKIKKNIGNVKYQIQFSANKNFDSVKKVSVNYNKQVYLIDYKLKTGKKYYYRVRGMKSVNGTTFYGKWSDVKQVKVSKAL